MKFLSGKDAVTRGTGMLIRKNMLKLLPGLVAGLLVGGVFLHEAFAQAPAQSPVPRSQEGTSHSNQTYAPVGTSGYVVPIPEIKLERIIGEKSRGAPPPVQKDEEAARAPTPATPAGPPEPSEETEVQEPQESLRLPFGLPRRPSEPTPTPEQSGTREPSPDLERPAFLTPPAAPDEVMEAPTPKKEILGKKHAPTIPGLMEAAPKKEALKPVPLRAQGALGLTGPEETIPLGTRAEPEVIPPVVREEPPPVPASLPEHRPAVVPKEALPPLARPIPELKLTPVEPLVSVPRETVPTLVLPVPEEKPTAIEPPVPVPKEVLQSPLDPAITDTAEVQRYLRETAPILEEMSLLMTRAPSMSIGDFDPSEPNAPIFPKDLHLKMDSMKRELQILDSKTFAIMPPKKYERFHALIRDSITQTHQACDAIADYIAEPTEGNFRAAQEHLQKSKELIEKTRPGHA